LFFTNRGRVFHLKAYEVPAASRQARGTPIVNLLQIERGERVTATLSVADFRKPGFLFMATKRGVVKKTNLAEFEVIRRNGLIAISLDTNDELNWVNQTDGKQDVILVTQTGMSIRFGEEDVRSMGRQAAGVRGVRLRRGDSVVSTVVARRNHDVLVMGENGYGKRTALDEYRKQSRGGKGIITMKVTQKTGSVLDAVIVHPDDEILVISTRGVILRAKVSDISVVGRNTQGVRIIRLDEGDRVAAVARIVQQQEE
jgi:DNA gyrase subunit A